MSEEMEESIYPLHLQGDNPLMWGFDYYTIIKCCSGVLAIVMTYLYFEVEDEELRNMVMMQGVLSICLLLASMYFRRNLHIK